jgi:hypothetical protein
VGRYERGSKGKTKETTQQRRNPDQLAAEPVTNQLLQEAEATVVNSVIEDTTDLLPIENRTRKL